MQISGIARNLQATIQPDDPSAPAESWMNTVTLAVSDSTFTYDGRPINNIDIQARGRANQTRVEVHELVLRSPVAEARSARHDGRLARATLPDERHFER